MRCYLDPVSCGCSKSLHQRNGGRAGQNLRRFGAALAYCPLSALSFWCKHLVGSLVNPPSPESCKSHDPHSSASLNDPGSNATGAVLPLKMKVESMLRANATLASSFDRYCNSLETTLTLATSTCLPLGVHWLSVQAHSHISTGDAGTSRQRQIFKLLQVVQCCKYRHLTRFPH